jgi:hypothetical protein
VLKKSVFRKTGKIWEIENVHQNESGFFAN